MKAKEIQELIDFIAKSGLDEVNIETEQFKISVKRSAGSVFRPVDTLQQPVLPVLASAVTPVLSQQPVVPTTPIPPQTPATPTPTATENKESKYIAIKSPMIGTFYRSSNPDSPMFVNVGDDVKKGQTVCIIEAMKLFNEIESEVSGKIVKILVENASPVEYDQPLFLVDPS
ncbi:acetyl-CoA carboxylase biotin carboxyl carrier protein [Rhodocytophaga rosea]|uniref:Biotin carboxyl carrier protein of acetyl-CoA carboxylase n=1 Tax=Rhodocytophaga rosea TaxID=2704465 RepID=A0A6C0GWP8_9BACT|nr:acetyl-CoA carboxylase biotin carboxyl carrier protein [Rhodocytophaga rosea]QHT72023.1 acetyl-CoA carboxylase biotin carboxyl carrier protein [Rhodocytophaga rosea]